MGLLDRDEFDRWREQSAQLAVQRLLRAIGKPGDAWGHDLVSLVDRAAHAVGDPVSALAVVDASARLARHYIPARYPDAHPAGTRADHYRESDAAAAIGDGRRASNRPEEPGWTVADSSDRG